MSAVTNPSSHITYAVTTAEQQIPKIEDLWDEYFGQQRKLRNWQRLCGELGLPSNLPSLTKCRNVRLHLT